TLKNIVWYTDRQLTEISLGGLIVLVIIRTIQFNMSRARDRFLHTNLCATLANMSNHFKRLNPYVCQRLVSLFEKLSKKFTKILKDIQLNESKTNGVEQSDVSSDCETSSLAPELTQDMSIFEEVLRMILEIINACLAAQLTNNPNLVYTLLYKRQVLEPFHSHPCFQDIVMNIETVLTYFSNRIEGIDRNLSVSEVYEIIQQSSLQWPSDRLKKFPELRFRYVEDEQPEEFFIPYIWSLVFHRLPFSIRVLLESAIRSCDGFQVKEKDVEKIIDWEIQQKSNAEIPFKPSRVILQDLTGVPAVVDFAAMREAFQTLGGDPNKINPLCPADLVIDHSVQVDFSRTAESLHRNEELEFQRNKERFEFLKWGSTSLKNTTIIPPGSGICHQVNLEYLARVVFKGDNNILYPDSVVGLDSHTTMINGLGVVGWGVGGIEAEAVMLGQAICMVLPEVVGYKLVGKLPSYATSTDVVLTITKNLRQMGVVGKFVEFYGPGVSELSIADRATIANMCPEYGATIGYFPTDKTTIDYLFQTGREDNVIKYAETYLKAVKMFRNDYNNSSEDPVFTRVIELDLNTITPSVSGPKRPHDRVSVSQMKQDFQSCLTNKIGFKGFGIADDKTNTTIPFIFDGKEYCLSHGSVVIAAITSCTNTSNPSVMLGAGMLCKNAVEKGLTVAPYIKTSMSPGSGVVTFYLRESGVTILV
ncbi:unnamed protein product, partial [Medioppia subpectinata]